MDFIIVIALHSVNNKFTCEFIRVRYCEYKWLRSRILNAKRTHFMRPSLASVQFFFKTKYAGAQARLINRFLHSRQCDVAGQPHNSIQDR